MKKSILLLLPIILIGLYSCNYKQKKAEAEQKQNIINSTLIEVGQTVPEFSYVTLEGDTLNIDDLKGKVVFMNFFATSCPICIKELPVLNTEIWEKYKDNENFVLLVFGREHNAGEMNAFIEKWGYTFPVIPDPGRKIYSLFAERYIPRNVILNTEGEIIYQVTGFEESEIEQYIELLNKELS